MEELRDLAKQCIKIKKEEYQGNADVKIVGIKYFVVLENGEIKQSDFDPLLSNSGIELALIFPKIHYQSWSRWYDSYLDPIIINNKLEAIERKLEIDDWTIEIRGQNIEAKPLGITIIINNKSLGYYSYNSTEIEYFGEFYKFLVELCKCKTKIEANYLTDLRRNSEKLEDLENLVTYQKAELHIQQLIIDAYKSLLESIADMVHLKK